MKKKEYIIPKIEVTHIDAEEMLHLPGASRFDNNGDHQSADDDDAYAKQYDWGLQDSDENDWDKADEAY